MPEKSSGKFGRGGGCCGCDMVVVIVVEVKAVGGERVGGASGRWAEAEVGAGEARRREKHGEHGWRAEGEAQGVGDYAGSTGRWERRVARYEVVCVHGGRGRFEDVIQALGGERECF